MKAKRNTNNILIPDENSLAELDERLTNLPVGFVDLCLEAITTRQEIIDWVKEDLIEIHVSIFVFYRDKPVVHKL